MTPAVFVASEEVLESDGGFGVLEDVCRRTGASFVVACRGPVKSPAAALHPGRTGELPVLSAEDLPGVPEGHHREDPACGCGACRVRTLMLSTTGDDHFLVYIGGSAEDIVPARAADMVFARGALQTCCQRENISITPFDALTGVAAELGDLFARPRLRKRWMAEQHRRSLFMAEA